MLDLSLSLSLCLVLSTVDPLFVQFHLPVFSTFRGPVRCSRPAPTKPARPDQVQLSAHGRNCSAHTRTYPGRTQPYLQLPARVSLGIACIASVTPRGTMACVPHRARAVPPYKTYSPAPHVPYPATTRSPLGVALPCSRHFPLAPLTPHFSLCLSSCAPLHRLPAPLPLLAVAIS
jgi:hypothetical protein